MDLFELENRIRILLSELVSPILHKTAENEAMIKQSLKNCRKNKQKIEALNNEFNMSISKLVPYDEFNKRVEYLLSESKSSAQYIGYSVEILDSKLQEAIHAQSDSTSRIKSLEGKHKIYTENIEDNYRNIREFQDLINLERNKMQKQIQVFIDNQQPINENTKEKIEKLNTRLNDLNTKAFPEMTCLIEKRNFKIEELNRKVNESVENRVVPSDFILFKNKMEYDIKKINTELNENIGAIKNFLDQMLKLEINCEISDTLLQVLDLRQVKKLIPILENQLSINHTNKDSTIYSYQNPIKTSGDTLYNKTLAQIKNLENSIIFAKEKVNKERASKEIVNREKEKEKVPLVFSKKSFESIPQSRNSIVIQNNLINNNINKSPKEQKKIEISELKIEEIKKEPETELIKIIEKSSKETQLDKQEFEYIENNTLRSNMSDDSNGYSNIEIKEMYETIEKYSEAFNFKIQKIEQQTEISLNVLSDELKYSIKAKGSEINEINHKIEESIKDINAQFISIENLEQKINKTAEKIGKLIENIKIIHNLLIQDEEDRQSLQLTCYTEGKPRVQSPKKQKTTVSLKPECLSCSAQNSIVFSAFKMACLNYCPSDIKYQARVYTRKALIEKLGEDAINIYPDLEQSLTEDSFKLMPMNDEIIYRTKSASKVKNPRRFILDASINKSLLSTGTPSKTKGKIKIQS